MSLFKIKTKYQVNIDKKPRVYFTCHPDDFEIYFGKVCDDIFKTHDCSIYYTEDMNERIAESEKELDLGRNNLFVIPVTFKLLSTSNRAMDEDIPYAFKEHIPVLPIMMEPGLDDIYSQRDKFGELQYLNPYSTDMTEIAYEEKLKKYLDSVLISDEMAKRVRAAFDAYIFLSYRKKDRKYANELMKLIHSNPECRDIAIWFDEFLTPGESFKEAIERILDDCQLFTLLITPSLLEKVIDSDGNEVDNYVIATELPMARKKKEKWGTDIFAVEMEKTDKENLSAINIEEYVNSKDEIFRARLLDAISKIAVTENNTPEHNYLIGLAYLEGIDVEVDRERGIELITSAAEDGLLEAMEKLYYMYINEVDYITAKKWAENIVDYAIKHFGEENTITFMTLHNLAFVCNQLGNYQKALQIDQKVYNLRCKIMGEEHPDTLTSLNSLAYDYCKLKDYKNALIFCQQAYEVRYRVCGKEHPDTLTSLNNLALAYSGLEEHVKALEIFRKVFNLSSEILGDKHTNTLITLHNIASTLGKLGEYAKATEMSEKIYKIQCATLGEEHPNTLESLESLMVNNMKLNNHEMSIEIGEKLYVSRERILGKEHPRTITILCFLMMECELQDDLKRCTKFREFFYEFKCKELGPVHPEVLEILNELLYNYMELRDVQNVVKTRERIYAIKSETLGEENPKVQFLLTQLIGDYKNIEEYKKALQCYEKLYEIEKKLGHDNDISLLKGMAFCHKKLGNYVTSLSLYKRVYACALKLSEPTDPYVLEIAECIEELTEILNTDG